MFTIRKATNQDARAIRKLINRVGINPIGLHWQRFLVAVDEQDRLLGCGQVKPHGDGTREMASIAVQPEQQGQGIGTAVIQRILAENPLPLYLTCRSVMGPYYQKFGFRALSFQEMPPYYRRLYRLVAFFRKFFRSQNHLLVMVKWSNRPSGQHN